MSKKMSAEEKKQYNDWQEQTVNELIGGLETMDEDEFERLYDQLDPKHQHEVEQASKDFMDGAVGW